MRFLIIWAVIAVSFTSQTVLAKTKVITTTTDLAALVKQIGGEHVEVGALCKANQDPHYVQTRPSLMVKLRRADLVLSVGLDLEIGWLPLIIRGARNPKIRPGNLGYLNLGTSVTAIDVPLSADASQGHVHTRGNPHYWLDPVRIAKLIPIIAQGLSAVDPEHTKAYQTNANTFGQALDKKIAVWDKRMAPYRGTEVLSYHDTFNYFYLRYGLINAGTLENKPGIPPSPRHLSSLIQTAKFKKIPVLFHEAFHDKKPSGLVADRSGAKLLILPVSVGAMPKVKSYTDLIDMVVDQFVTAMTSR
jgi:zinc/manganese transport system substrate-binding protein